MHRSHGGFRRLRRTTTATIAVAALTAAILPATAVAQEEPSREGLGRGLFDAESAHTPNVEHLSFTPRTDQEADRTNSDMAFTDGHVVVGNYAGFNIYDLADPERPRLVSAVTCPGNQHDVTVDGDLLFLSVQTYGTSFENCQIGAAGDVPFAGMRVFDISNKARPQQVATVQTCRGSHTHTLVPDPDGENAYLYVSGTSPVRTDAPGIALGCATSPESPAVQPYPQTPLPGDEDARWRIDIIEVPLDAPEDAALVSGPRLFEEDGTIAGLQQEPPTEFHPSGPDHRAEGRWSPAPVTDACHDITAYPELGIAAGACEGNGLLIDITDPVNPTRITAVSDANFAYWHSATFNNDGTKVVFTDEWGGGGQGFCAPDTTREWGANGIYDIVRDGDGDITGMEFVEYYKIPNVQEENEICVAHNGNLIPIPGRDIMVQAWYQGGMSIWEFTDSENPVELAWFDRGPIQTDPDGPVSRGGFWSTYWYDGLIYGTDITRGFDVFQLHGDDVLTQPEVDAAMALEEDQVNAQTQYRYDTEVADPSPACDDVDPVTFPDMPSGPPHGANVGCIAGYGIAQGSTDGTYRPETSVRRDQMTSFIARMLTVGGIDLPTDAPDAFDDDDGGTHEEATNQLAAAGIVEGRGAGTFAPSGAVTRGQMASFIVRALEYALDTDLAPAGSNPFGDTAGSPHTDNITVASDLGIALGRTDTAFEPNSDVRRDQMGSFIARTLDVMVDEGLTLAPLS